MSQLDRTTFYSPVPSTKVLAPPGGGNSDENNSSQSLRVLAPPGGRVSLDLFSGYGQDVERPARKERVEVNLVKTEELVAETPKRKTRNILVSSPPGGTSSISLG